jgi:ketosteroid isomerase-like protein
METFRMNNPQSVIEIQQAMKAWAIALSEKDIAAMHKDYSETYCMFDVQETAESVEGVKALWERCMPYFDKPEIQYKNTVIHASDDMAVVHFRSNMSGMAMPIPDHMRDTWLRGTCCFKKIEGEWKCFHEHVSFAVDCETEKIAWGF